MDVKNLIGKLHHENENENQQEQKGESAAEDKPKVPVPPRPAQRPAPARGPAIEDNIRQSSGGGRSNMSVDWEGIILDLGEGISLNIPIQRRMSLSDFIKVAEKVKALEMLSESQEGFSREYFHHSD